MENNISKQQHNLNMKDREKVDMDGVKEVVTFNENKIILKTTMGNLEIKGKDLNIKQLDLKDGNINITGSINYIEYINQPSEKNFLKKIFK